MSEPKPAADAASVARQLAAWFVVRQQEYALGGAIALGYWGTPRGTVDVDVTLFLPPERPSDCLAVLQDLGCEFAASESDRSLREHGFCRVTYSGVRVDVFLPIVPFYETARSRRKQVPLADQLITIWDAETLTVFKMMFFRRKDLADVEQILRAQGPRFDREWVREQLAAMYGLRDPRVSQWDELANEVPAE